MLASDLVQKLEELIEESGDLRIVMADDTEPDVELDNEDPNDTVFVIS